MSVPAAKSHDESLRECVQEHCANLRSIVRAEVIAEHHGNPGDYDDYYCEQVALDRKEVLKVIKTTNS